MSTCQHLSTNCGRIFDDAVVNNGDAIGAIGVRVGVVVGHSAVRRPTRVTDAESGARHSRARERCTQNPQRPGPLYNRDSFIGGHSHSGRVIPTVLKTLETIQHYLKCVARPGVPHDPAHKKHTPSAGTWTDAQRRPSPRERRAHNATHHLPALFPQEITLWLCEAFNGPGKPGVTRR